MTDKQIIIDGIDVSGCEWYTQGATGMICADWHISNDCCRNYNCYYKQLKAKEQECEKLRFPMKDSNYAILTKEEFEEYDQLKAENKHLNDLLNQALKELEKTRETLTEIKEIAENAKTKVFVDMEEFWKQILQKISEVEE